MLNYILPTEKNKDDVLSFYASERVILKNGGVLESKLYDAQENVIVKRFWIQLQ